MPSTLAEQPSLAVRTEAFLRLHLRPIIVILSVLAAIRILIFAAAFPLFDITDEDEHFATVRMYAEGHLPGKELPAIDPETARMFLFYGSPEYTHSKADLDRDGPRVPFYQLPPQSRSAALTQRFYAEKLQDWANKPNFEAQSPPLYYIVAAAWYRLGAALGIRDWGLAYWVRFLNAIVYTLLVWLSYRFVRKLYPESIFVCVAVPAILAVFPQDVFFGMNRDVLSAPLAAAALLLMTNAIEAKRGNRSLAFGSLLVGLAFLVQVSNCVLFGALAISLWFWARGADESRSRKLWVVSASILAATALPLAWMLRNHLVIGDLTGSRAKMHELTWTVKPLAEMFHHPVFSWDGLSYFLLQLTRSFWHGEYFWHGQWMRSASADWFYVSSTAVMLIIFTFDFVARRKTLSAAQRFAGLQSFFLLGGYVLFLAVLSLLFDFHECIGPSRRHPFFINGRLISGAMLPFVLVYASGLEWVANRVRRWVPPIVVLLYMMALITFSEALVRWQVFSSAYNFFALSAWPR